MSIHRLWILGAADVEMAAIEQLLEKAGEHVTYAAIGHDRCHPGNAYRFTSPCGRGVDYDEVYLVRCDHAPIKEGWVTPRTRVVRIGHHRPGDPGYGKPPEEFLAASAIGQIVTHLGLIYHESYNVNDGEQPVKTGWYNDDWELLITDKELKHVAAADHCLYGLKYPG